MLRKQLLLLVETEGAEGLKRFVTQHRRETRKNPEKVLELKKSVYGIPSSGNSFATLMRTTHVEKCGVHQTETDPSIYIKIVVKPNVLVEEVVDNPNKNVHYVGSDGSEKIHCADGTVVEFLIIIVWTDDVRYFGTEGLRLQYEADIKSNLRVEFEGPSKSFVSCDFHQNFDEQTLEVTQAQYWVKCVEKNSGLWGSGKPKHRATPLSVADAATF